jgi:SAM-dependent methyltransferase
MSAPAADHAARAYDVFAGFYDDFTRGHDHVHWTATLERVALGAGLRGRRLLDLACGTGESFLAMLDRGYEVTACDGSPAMLARAAEKAGERARLRVEDLRALPLLGAFDLVWSLGDALNYLQSADELTAALRGAAANLAPGGLLLFDVNTLATFRSLYSSLLVHAGSDRVLILDGHGSRELEPGGAAEVWIDRLRAGDDGRWTRERSVHHHRHHPLATVRRALRQAGLESLAEHGSDLSGRLEPGVDESRHVKAVVLAHRIPQSSERR